jgi:hypothetical protein
MVALLSAKTGARKIRQKRTAAETPEMTLRSFAVIIL